MEEESSRKREEVQRLGGGRVLGMFKDTGKENTAEAEGARRDWQERKSDRK